METLEEKFNKALKVKRNAIAHHEKELKNLEKLSKRSSKIRLKWDDKVNCKNAYKTMQVAEILNAFRKRTEYKKAPSDIAQVRMSTHQLWKYCQPTAGAIAANSKFRNHLNWLKTNDFLLFNKTMKEWRLTDKAISWLSV